SRRVQSRTCAADRSRAASSPRPVGNEEILDHPGVAALRPYVVVAERLGDREEPLARDAEPRAELLDVGVRRLVAALADDRDRAVARHAAVADVDGEVVERSREPELVPLEPVVNGDEVVIDIRVVPHARACAIAALEAMLRRYLEALLGIPAEVV